ncbi:MAG: hypothetical protein ACLGG7_06030 [Bacteriovoracia bacterium]
MQHAAPTGEQSKAKEKVSLQQLAELTGFSPELIKQELFPAKEGEDAVSLEELRSLMMNFIDATMLTQEEQK